jgi:hypothetical protein
VTTKKFFFIFLNFSYKVPALCGRDFCLCGGVPGTVPAKKEVHIAIKYDRINFD